MKKIEDRVIYRHTNWYSTFPSLTRAENGDILCGFRRAPLKEDGGHIHVHSLSRALFVRSSDDGDTWTSTPEALCPEDELGQQDPQLATLADGTVVGSFFRWQAHSPLEKESLAAFDWRERMGCLWTNAGIAVTWSRDDGRTWSGLHRVPFPWRERNGASRAPVVETSDRRLLLPCYGPPTVGDMSIAYLMQSSDRGQTWNLFSIMADGREAEEPYHCHEPFVLRTGARSLACFIRCYGENGLMRVCTSDDEGATWSEPLETAVWGFPQAALQLGDGRIVLTYGYRREPFGVRARILGPDLSGIHDAEELVLRDDGGATDLGYPTLVARNDGTVLIAYYFHHADAETRQIACTIVDPE